MVVQLIVASVVLYLGITAVLIRANEGHWPVIK